MKIFLSHSSADKSNIKSIIRYLPPVLSTWLDENNLIGGSNLNDTFEKAIKTECDYILVFLGNGRESNSWVLKELAWGMEKQKEIQRTFIIPVIMPNIIGEPFDIFPEIQGIKYLKLDNYEEIGFKACAEKIFNHLISLVIQDLDYLRHPKQSDVKSTIKQANDQTIAICNKLYEIIFKHRQDNPIMVEILYEKMMKVLPESYDFSQFLELLDYAVSQMPGIYYDREELYVIEEHARLKSIFGAEKKKEVATEAAKLIKSGQTVFIDAGSTMNEIVKIICTRIKSHNLARVNIIVISTDQASLIADACATMGYDQDNSPIQLFIPGGMVRPNTKAIVDIDIDKSELSALVEWVKHVDIAFVGANGATVKDGITTHNNSELKSKRLIISCAKEVFYVFDDSKCGIRCEEKLTDFEDNMGKVITNANEENCALKEILDRYHEQIILSKKRM